MEILKTQTARLLIGLLIAFPPAAAVHLLFSETASYVLLAVLTGANLFIGRRNSALAAGAIVVASLLVVVAALFLPDGYYRPHEKYALADRYKPNVRDAMRMPFGDLVAIGGSGFESAAEPRDVVFVSDSRGFPNRHDLKKGMIVLVGDSFVAGNSMSHDDLLGEKLQRLSGREVYSLGFPGDVLTYMKNLAAIGEAGYVFAFEGNDFETRCTEAPEEVNGFARIVDGLRRVLPPVQRVYALRKRVASDFRRIRRSWMGRPDEPPVVAKKVGGKDMLFLAQYMAMTRRPAYEFPDCVIDAVARHARLIKALFFIPDKYRVYHPAIAGESGPLPHANWDALRRLGARLSISTLDLTPALQNGAAEALRQNRFVYWRDDTHWNGLGTDIAAREIARVTGLKP